MSVSSLNTYKQFLEVLSGQKNQPSATSTLVHSLYSINICYANAQPSSYAKRQDRQSLPQKEKVSKNIVISVDNPKNNRQK